MCGGSLEILPCSRVGHMYRYSTYSYDGDREKITARNNIRAIEGSYHEYLSKFHLQFLAFNHNCQNNIDDDLFLFFLLSDHL